MTVNDWLYFLNTILEETEVATDLFRGHTEHLADLFEILVLIYVVLINHLIRMKMEKIWEVAKFSEASFVKVW